MKLHRVFIAINMPDKAKEELLAYQNKWPEVPAQWTKTDNMHITLAFLGNTSDQELAEICELLQPVGERHKPFSISAEKIAFGPKPESPRMVWVQVEKSPQLLELQKDVQQTLKQGSNKHFSPHVILARVKAFQLQRIEPEEIPVVDEEISISFPVQSIEVMESELKRGGARYTICQEIPLTGN